MQLLLRITILMIELYARIQEIQHVIHSANQREINLLSAGKKWLMMSTEWRLKLVTKIDFYRTKYVT